MPAPPLLMQGVGKQLSGKCVLRQVSLCCPPGTITALLGPNGAGKTTVLSVAAGLRRPDCGRVEIFGIAPSERAARCRFSLVPQELSFPAPVRVARVLDFVARQRDPSTVAPAWDEICQRLELDRLLARRLGGLSGGQRRRVALAAGLVRVPGLLMLDEATTGLDEGARATTWAMIGDYAERGGSVVVTSHILADIDVHAHRVVALAAGRIVFDRPIEQVRRELGGSTVTVRVPPGRAASLAVRVSALPLTAHPRAAPPGTIAWQTPDALALVRAVTDLEPSASELRVIPIPLGELLEQLSRPDGLAMAPCAPGEDS